MKTHTFTIDEKDWKQSKFSKRDWEKRVNIVRWEHDFESEIYRIDIAIK